MIQEVGDWRSCRWSFAKDKGQRPIYRVAKVRLFRISSTAEMAASNS